MYVFFKVTCGLFGLSLYDRDWLCGRDSRGRWPYRSVCCNYARLDAVFSHVNLWAAWTCCTLTVCWGTVCLSSTREALGCELYSGCVLLLYVKAFLLVVKNICCMLPTTWSDWMSYSNIFHVYLWVGGSTAQTVGIFWVRAPG